jgi:hypothetical protein
MTDGQSITACLISCRNILVGNRTHENVLPCLQDVLSNLDSITVPSSRKIIERCVAYAIDQIKDADFISAGRILNLIHNLPLDEARERRWDIDYFFWMELPVFLEHFKEVRSARSVVLYVCKQLACSYMPDRD